MILFLDNWQPNCNFCSSCTHHRYNKISYLITFRNNFMKAKIEKMPPHKKKIIFLKLKSHLWVSHMTPNESHDPVLIPCTTNPYEGQESVHIKHLATLILQLTLHFSLVRQHQWLVNYFVLIAISLVQKQTIFHIYLLIWSYIIFQLHFISRKPILFTNHY